MEVSLIVSEIYNSLFEELTKEDRILLSNFRNDLSKFSSKHLNRVIKFIEKETKLKFKKEEYECFLVIKFPLLGISYPLIIKFSNDVYQGFVTLVHELIHRLMVENNKEFKRIFDKLNKELNVPIELRVPHEKVLSHVVIYDLLNKIHNKYFPDYEISKHFGLKCFKTFDFNKIKAIEY